MNWIYVAMGIVGFIVVLVAVIKLSTRSKTRVSSSSGGIMSRIPFVKNLGCGKTSSGFRT